MQKLQIMLLHILNLKIAKSLTSFFSKNLSYFYISIPYNSCYLFFLRLKIIFNSIKKNYFY